jgi:hypothetical protein
LVALAAPASAADNGAGGFELQTNQQFVEQARRRPAENGMDIADPMSVLTRVLNSLPDRVKVYPTENYYYFKFYHGHRRYAGNLRLDVTERENGKINFAYFEDLTEWTDQAPVVHRLLGAEQGVRVEKLEDLLYRVTYAGRSVVFAHNDLRHVRPGPGMLAEGERYIGPVFDESAIQFLLVFNSALKIFHYVLDERVPSEPLAPIRSSPHILIGQRTGFAYFQDRKLPRKILIGVHEANARVNNYYDGPFDQLPDNFIEGEALRSAILEVEPHLAGKIDRLGISPGGADRYMIAPYAHYRTEEDLTTFHECATSAEVPASHYYACFVVDPEEPSDGTEATAPPGAEAPPSPPAASGPAAPPAPRGFP